MDHLGLKFADAVEHLAYKFSVPIDSTRGNQLSNLSDSLPHPQPKKPKEKPKGVKSEREVTVNEVYIKRSHERLFHPGSVQSQAIAWLTGSERNFSHEMIAHYQLGLEPVHCKNPDSGSWEEWWGIAIFIPVPDHPGRYYKKIRVAPWLASNERPDYVRRWSQYGVPTTVWLTHNPEDATQTWFCEGEWDAMHLGWLALFAGEKVAIACSTGGCGTVPPLAQLNALPMPVFTWFDRNDRLNKHSLRPGDEGARKLVESISGQGFAAQVPMPENCLVEGWDVSDALVNGYNLEDFKAAADSVKKASTAIVLYSPTGQGDADWQSDWQSQWQQHQSAQSPQTENGGNGGSPGQNFGGRRPNRREVKGFCQKAFDALYGDKHWIWVFNHLYYWNENYYEGVDTNAEISRINHYCDTYEAVKEIRDPETGEVIEEIVTYPYARPKYVNEVFNWVTQKLSIDSNRVNPPGLNCLDGVLELSYDPDSKKWQRNLTPHDPKKHLYLYPPQTTYNIPVVVKPDACDQLLSCLDAPQRDIFLKIVGASLDLNTVRIYKGREIKALLMWGLGNNGKDTLRETTAMMFGYRGMVGASLSDFKQYDEGRKFPLAKLDGALINWPSENADCMLLDRLQSIKIAITGDPLSAEKKGRDEYQFNPKCVHLFNVNSLPHLLGAIEAITSRFGILGFTKTFKSNPGPGELKADPRFLYDKSFVRTEVLPWYLHRVLDALDRLMVEGIDYTCTSAAFENAREESDHIYSFCKEVGIGYLPHAQITATDVWERLRQWYIANGTLEVKDLGDGKTKETWNNQTTWGDHTVKGLNQILPRLLKIFPKATRARDNQGRNCLEGIGFLPPDSGGGGGDSGGGGGDSGGGSPPNPPNSTNGNSVSYPNNSEAGLNVSEAGLNQFNPSSSKGSEATEANPAISRVKNLWSVLTEEERMQFLQELGLEKNSGVNSSKKLQQVHNQDTASDTASSVDVQIPSEQVQNLPTPPTTVQALANDILLCQTWVAVAEAVNRDGDKLKKAAISGMTKEQRSWLTTMLAAHLCDNPSDLSKLQWVPVKLRDRALERLTFTIRRLERQSSRRY
jgi:phage/plasmid-associated DNA primase